MPLIANRDTCQSRAVTAPVGGWDTESALSDMPEENAVILDNWFAEPEKVTVRPDHTSWATGLGGAVESLIPYVGEDGSAEIFGAANGDIFDVTAGGAVGAAVVASRTNDRHQHVQQGTAGGEFVIVVNGEDTPQTYNGTTWADATFTGPTIANVIWVNLHHKRIFMGEVDSLTFWFLGTDAITGAASQFSLKGEAKRGGYIMAMGSWTRDGGDGPDDVAVFLTSEGEAIVYSGTDPTTASEWAKVGVFNIGRPIGRRCVIKAGADLIIVTEDGFVSASSILSLDRSQAELVAISRQINSAVNKAVRSKGSLFGWQPILYPKGQMLIFNVPQSTTTAHQYVFNTLTQAPCRFKNINALCWGLAGDTAYLGDSAGVVHKFDTGAKSDNGTNIEADALPAFNYFGSNVFDKKFSFVEQIFQSTAAPAIAISLQTDFEEGKPPATPVEFPSSGDNWGVGKWGVAKWGTSDQIFKAWRGVRGKGRAASLRTLVSTTTSRPSWISTNFIYTPAGKI